MRRWYRRAAFEACLCPLPKGLPRVITWRTAAGALRALGVERGDRVVLMMRNVPYFHVLDVAALMLGRSHLCEALSLQGFARAHALSDAQLAELEGKLRARERHKFKAAEWFDLDELPPNLTGTVAHVLRDYRRGILFSEQEK